jgi:hypothetical protein
MKLSTLFSLAIVAGLMSASAHAAARCDNTYEKLDAYSGGQEYNLGECAGSIWVDRISSKVVKLHVKANECSNVRIIEDSGYAFQANDKLDTSRGTPYVSRPDFYLEGHYFSPDKAELEFSSNNCKHRVRIFIHY